MINENNPLPTEVTQALELRAKAAQRLVEAITKKEKATGKLLKTQIAPGCYVINASVTTSEASSTIIIAPDGIYEHRTEANNTSTQPLDNYDLLKKALEASLNAPPKEVVPQTIDSIRTQVVIADQTSRDLS